MNVSVAKDNIPKWILREPDEKELEEFKKHYFSKFKYDEAFKKLLYMVGELQSENQELRHVIDNIDSLKKEIAKHMVMKEMINKETRLKRFLIERSNLLNDVLFYEMKLGLW